MLFKNMLDNHNNTLISLKLADGQLFPIFETGQTGTKELSLIPAHNGQDMIDLHFFYHPSNNLDPVGLGSLMLNLPNPGEASLILMADLITSGAVTIKITEAFSGISETLEMLVNSKEDFDFPDHTEAAKKTPKNMTRMGIVVSVIITIILLLTSWWITRGIFKNSTPVIKPVASTFSTMDVL